MIAAGVDGAGRERPRRSPRSRPRPPRCERRSREAPPPPRRSGPTPCARSSPASRTTVSPSAHAAEQRHQGKLVDRERHLVALHRGAHERRGGHVELSDRLVGRLAGSVAVLDRSGSSRSASTTAPIRRAIRRNAERVQFRETPLSTIREPGTQQAAATMNAADEGSPGTATSSSSSSSTWHTRSRSPSWSNGTRERRRMRSVWSRLGAGSRTVVLPSASIPAISRHDLTWALATGSSWWAPVSSTPRTVSGGVGPRAPRCGPPCGEAAPPRGPPGGGGSTRRRRSSTRRLAAPPATRAGSA